jgi:hypothetical protein
LGDAPLVRKWLSALFIDGKFSGALGTHRRNARNHSDLWPEAETTLG